jgi:hypothetical protein
MSYHEWYSPASYKKQISDRTKREPAYDTSSILLTAIKEDIQCNYVESKELNKALKLLKDEIGLV